jgi:hypothetical protein
MKRVALLLALAGCTSVTSTMARPDPELMRQAEEHERRTDPGLGFDPVVCDAGPDPMQQAALATLEGSDRLSTAGLTQPPSFDAFGADRCEMAKRLASFHEPVLSTKTGPLTIRLIEQTADGWRVFRLTAKDAGGELHLHTQRGEAGTNLTTTLDAATWERLAGIAKQALEPSMPGDARGRWVIELAHAGSYRSRDLDRPTVAMQALSRELDQAAQAR